AETRRETTAHCYIFVTLPVGFWPWLGKGKEKKLLPTTLILPTSITEEGFSSPAKPLPLWLEEPVFCCRLDPFLASIHFFTKYIC
ncbi:hypothetical protein AMECASPLE_015589, partial [Ameca splendens]